MPTRRLYGQTYDEFAIVAATPIPVEGNLSVSSGLNIPAHDHISLSHTGDNLTGVVYRTGGEGGTVVATLTLTYDGSGRLLTVAQS